ncbi:MAG: hypothetical protein J7M21_03170, partial [Planctomycetes bacterium]|nr:hypothetical protein [Planctomycetota bacterium]
MNDRPGDNGDMRQGDMRQGDGETRCPGGEASLPAGGGRPDRTDDMLARIGRLLDGELTGEERDELTRRALRDPQLHRLLDETRSIDRLAGEALRAALAGPEDQRLGEGLAETTAAGASA